MRQLLYYKERQRGYQIENVGTLKKINKGKGKKMTSNGTKDNPDIFHGPKEEKTVRASRKGFGR
ncbi:hypothetical protein [Algoriphagus antarcticus]|uniref:hypothetical protein n=1 Tax=Algoriphagus antarcticus TaxID=238540 RepID=UPI000A3D235B|nr:hypothetical protein [Algoriphagus antarcticus]